MIVRYLQIIKKPVVELKGQTHLGSVAEVIFNKSDLKIKAFLVKNRPILAPNAAATFTDIVELDKEAVLVADEDSVAPLSELTRVKEALKSGFFGIGQKVVTKDGKRIGNVYDYTFDSKSGYLLKLYVKGLLSDRIIGRQSIIEVSRKKVIVENDFELLKEPDPVLEADPC